MSSPSRGIPPFNLSEPFLDSVVSGTIPRPSKVEQVSKQLFACLTFAYLPTLIDAKRSLNEIYASASSLSDGEKNCKKALDAAFESFYKSLNIFKRLPKGQDKGTYKKEPSTLFAKVDQGKMGSEAIENSNHIEKLVTERLQFVPNGVSNVIESLQDVHFRANQCILLQSTIFECAEQLENCMMWHGKFVRHWKDWMAGSEQVKKIQKFNEEALNLQECLVLSELSRAGKKKKRFLRACEVVRDMALQTAIAFSWLDTPDCSTKRDWEKYIQYNEARLKVFEENKKKQSIPFTLRELSTNLEEKDN